VEFKTGHRFRFLLLGLIGLTVLIAGFANWRAQAAALPQVDAKAAVLLDPATGKVLFAKNPDTAMAPASTTKIMTAILAIERGGLSQTIRVSPNAVGIDGSSMALASGERLRMEDLLYGLMLVSGNDAAVAIADAIAGSEAEFARLMTAKARKIGLTNTNYKNPNGLPALNHYSTARDLAKLTAYAMRNSIFARIVATKVKTIPGSKPGETVTLYNHNKLLWRYPYTTGVKTGYTLTAGGCLVAAAKKDGATLISVVLKSNAIYDDSIKLFDYGFKQKSGSRS
jgi:D-alanyl-D-alanine carboxypeptidase (penicillin-binding protein 5/6)